MLIPAAPRIVPTMPIIPGMSSLRTTSMWLDGGEVDDVVVDADDARRVLLAEERAGDVRAPLRRTTPERHEVHVVARRRRRGLAHDEAPLCGELRRVHERHRLVDDRLEHALQDREREHPAVVVGDLALVGDLERVGRPRRRAR